MKKIIKTIAVFAVSALLISGCKNTGGKTNGGYYPTQTNSVIQAGFNEETYVWESLNFSTNRVNNAR